MALRDYYLCDKCGSKAFYDAELNYQHTIAGDLKLDYVGEMAVICEDCSKKFEVVIRERHPSDLKAAERVKVPDYKQALQNILDGNYPQPPRNGKCKHERFSWEECTVCIDDYIESVLAAAPTKETDHE